MTRPASPLGIITTHSALSYALPGDGEPPTTIQLFAVGESKPRNGNPAMIYIEDEAHAEQIARASATFWGDVDPVLDYDHQSLRAAGVAGTAKAAGWIKRIFATAKGLFADVEWTAAASAAIKAKEYRYISPAFRHRADGRVTQLINAGLTNTPNLNLMALADSATDDSTQETDMDLKAIATALGLGEDADEAAIVAAIGAQKGKADALTATASALGVEIGEDLMAVASAAAALKSAAGGEPDPAKFVSVDTVKELQAEMSALGTKVAGFEKTERDLLIEDAVKSGKLPPALKSHAEGIVDKMALASFLGALAPTKLGEQMPDPGKTAEGGDKSLTEDEIAICSAIGVSHEDFLKTRDGK